MKTFLSRAVALMAVCLLTLPPVASAATAASSRPVPLILNQKAGALSVSVPRGIIQATVERRAGNGWKPVKVHHVAFKAGEISKVIAVAAPAGVPASQLRVLGYRAQKFPSRFLAGKKTFERVDASASAPVVLPSYVAGGTDGVLREGDSPVPQAEESDIWKSVGKWLFFFNQYRGMQVFDMSDPAQPVRTGTLRLAASGEQFYSLAADGSALALLGRSNSKARQGQAALFVLKVEAGVPRMTREIPIEGDIQDSRLVGRRLYVVSSVWTQDTTAADGWLWTGESVLQTIDLTDPENPVARPTFRFRGQQSALQAVAGKLLLGTSDYWWSGAEAKLHVIDISAADGQPNPVKSLKLLGAVQDKFKMGVTGNAVVAVTHRWSAAGVMQTWIESYPLDGAAVAPLARKELVQARNESLHATRFDGDRVYIVTFQNIDPLFVVDLANPAQPEITGVLEIPGWSTYIEPLGDRLLAVGVEDGRVAVSLFNVAEPSAPALLSRVMLGKVGSYSWSEANYDEKAVGYFAREGILMVPFQSWGPEGTEKAMQIVRVGATSLTLGNTLKHEFDARRGTMLGSYFLSISGQEMLVMNRANTSGVPEVAMSLAWRADRVLTFGDYLIQIEDGPDNYGFRFWGGWGAGSGKAMIRVSRADDPDALVEEIELAGGGKIIGVTGREGRVYIGQWVPGGETQPASLRTWIFDVSNPPVFTEVGTVEHVMPGMSENELNLAAAQALWVNPARFVWFVPGQERWNNWWWWRPIEAISLAVVPDGGSSSAGAVEQTPDYTAAVLCPVATLGDAVAGPVVRVNSDVQVRDVSAALAASGFVFFSHDGGQSDSVTVQPLPVNPAPMAGAALDAPMVLPVYWQPQGKLKSWLRVVDFRGITPVARDATSIPGQLLAVSQADGQGAVVLTNAQGSAGSEGRTVQACAYDGITAWQLDSVTLPVPFWTPSTTGGKYLFFGRGESTPGVVSLGYNDVTGRLARLGEWSTKESPASLHAIDGHLLASSYGALEVARITVAGGLVHRAAFDTPVNLWLGVERSVVSPAGLWIPAYDYGVEFLPWTDLGVMGPVSPVP